MVFKDVGNRLYLKIFNSEYCCSKLDWRNFIKNKDIGIEHYYVDTVAVYKITDTKKWLMTRLKYGI